MKKLVREFLDHVMSEDRTDLRDLDVQLRCITVEERRVVDEWLELFHEISSSYFSRKVAENTSNSKTY